MIDPNTLSSLVGMKIEDAEGALKRMFAEEKTPHTWSADLNINSDCRWDEKEPNKLIYTATIKMGGDAN